MRAVIYRSYGPPEVLKIEELKKPMPKSGEVLIKVCAVCSAANHSLVKSLGATTVIDYTKTDFTQVDKQYDLIFDAVGKISLTVCKKLLRPKGVFKTVNKGMARVRGENQLLLKKLLESGQLKIVIDREYTLDQIVDAHRYVDLGRKKGNVVVNVINSQ